METPIRETLRRSASPSAMQRIVLPERASMRTSTCPPQDHPQLRQSVDCAISTTAIPPRLGLNLHTPGFRIVELSQSPPVPTSLTGGGGEGNRLALPATANDGPFLSVGSMQWPFRRRVYNSRPPKTTLWPSFPTRRDAGQAPTCV